MDRVKILLLIILLQVTSIIIHLITLMFAPIYVFGAIFWDKETFNKVMQRLYENIPDVNF